MKFRIVTRPHGTYDVEIRYWALDWFRWVQLNAITLFSIEECEELINRTKSASKFKSEVVKVYE